MHTLLKGRALVQGSPLPRVAGERTQTSLLGKSVADGAAAPEPCHLAEADVSRCLGRMNTRACDLEPRLLHSKQAKQSQDKQHTPGREKQGL